MICVYFIDEGINLCKKCPYSELFWSAFSHIQTEYGEILRISPYSVRMQENADQNNSEYGQFSRSINLHKKLKIRFQGAKFNLRKWRSNNMKSLNVSSWVIHLVCTQSFPKN